MPEGNRPDSRNLARKVIDLLAAELAADGFDLVDVRVFQGGGRYQVRIFVDLAGEESPAQGISLDEVARASRSAGMLLEEADLFADRYVIEVSSPGIRRPLRTVAHFERVQGEKVDLKVARSGRVRGVLSAVEGQILVVDAEEAEGEDPGEPRRIDLRDVIEANLDPEFDAQAIINADRRQRKEDKRRKREERTGRKKGRPKKRS